MIIWIAPVLALLSFGLTASLDFLRSIPSLIAPKPTPKTAPYIPPFTGGQCLTQYIVAFTLTKTEIDGRIRTENDTRTVNGRVLGGYTLRNSLTASNGWESISVGIVTSGGNVSQAGSSGGGGTGVLDWILTINSVTRVDGQSDNCGNIPNPASAPSIANDGLFTPQNPDISQAAIIVAPALPLALIASVLAGYTAAMTAAQAALAALDAIKEVAKGLDYLKDLFERLRKFLDKEEKKDKAKRRIERQTYGTLTGDGAIDFYPLNNVKYEASQLDIVITNIPIGMGKYFGSFSPNRYKYLELGYVCFYSNTQGILETHSIQFKRHSFQIPELAIGFIYHFGLNNQVQGFAFATFSVEQTG